ncbi:MAG: hypothetical protein ACK5XV_06520 [Flavobacteriales bacterium]
MTIDRTQYEAFFLDYLEGRLSPDEAQAVEAFAAAHPDLEDELNGMRAMGHLLTVPLPGAPDLLDEKSTLYQHSWNEEDPLLPLNPVTFTDKTALKKPLFAREEEELLLAALAEGDSDAGTTTKAHLLLATKPWLTHDVDLLRRMRVTPEPVIFMHKADLRRGDGRVVPFLRYLSYAAAAALVAWVVAIALPGKPADARLAAGFASSLRKMEKSGAPSTSGSTEETTPIIPHSPRSNVPVIGPANPSDREPLDLAAQPAHQQENTPDQNEQPLLPEQHEKPQQIQPVPENPMLPQEQQLALLHSPPLPGNMQHINRVEQYQTVLDFVKAKAKNKLWGGEDYPADKFALAIAQREVQRRFNSSAPFIEVINVKTSRERRLTVRIGKLVFSRKR